MPRKIANKALIQTLKDAKDQMVLNVSHHKWMISSVWDCVSWGQDSGKRKKEEISKSLEAIELSTRSARDIDHAIAALEQEKDDE